MKVLLPLAVVLFVILPKDMNYVKGCGHVPVLPPEQPTPTPGSFLDLSEVDPLLEVQYRIRHFTNPIPPMCSKRSLLVSVRRERSFE